MGANLPTVAATVAQILQGIGTGSLELGQLYTQLTEALQAREDDRQNAYRERNALVAFLSRCYPSHLAKHPAEDTSWDPAWCTIVCIHAEKAPGGSMRRVERWTLCWHIHDDEVPLFAHLEMQENDWDGSSTEVKYERLEMLP